MSDLIDVAAVRDQFPALAKTQAGKPVVFLDNPGGTQVHQAVVQAVSEHLIERNANHGGAFITSRESDAVVEEARRATADLVNAASPEEMVFGPNMTTLTMGLSRALGRDIGPGDEIVVSRLDHDANISPWLLIAQDKGAEVRWVDFDTQDCTLHLADFEAAINQKTKIVAVGYASNATGTINDVAAITSLARAAGALTFIDAVAYAPHGPIDVQAIGCDFLAFSAYKIFGPHVGVLYGRRELLERLIPYKVRPASNQTPDKFETGTQNFEGIAGTLATIDYLAGLGQKYGADTASNFPGLSGRRLLLKCALSAIQTYERGISAAILEALADLDGLKVHGLTDPARLAERAPTISFTWPNRHPRDIAAALGEEGVFVWDGNYYALAVTEGLGLEGKGGMVRVGAVHYNTLAEVERLKEALGRLV